MTQELLVGIDDGKCSGRVVVYATKWAKVATNMITVRKGQSLIGAKLFGGVASTLV